VRRLLIPLFIISFMLAIFAMLPMAAVRKMVPQLAMAQAYGTIWRGELQDVRIAKLPPMRVDITGDPLGLIKLGYAADFRAQANGITARGKASAGLAGLSLEGVAATIDLSPLPLDIPVTGTINLQNISMTLKNDGTCSTAGGRIASDLLQRSAQMIGGWRGPLLLGKVTCEGGQLTANLTGKTNLGETIDIRFGLEAPNLLPTGAVEINSSDLVLTTALQKLGFQSVENGSWRLNIIKGRMS